MSEPSLSREALEAELVRLREERDRLGATRDLAQTLAGLGTWEWDLAAGRVIASDEFFRIAGLSPTPGFSLADYGRLVHPDDRARVDLVVRTAVEARACYDVECRLVRPDGDVRHVLCRGQVLLDKEGTAREVVGIVQDITDRTRAVLAMRESEARYRLLAENINDVISVTTETGGVRYVSPALTRLLGYTPEELARLVADHPSHDLGPALLHPEDLTWYGSVGPRLAAGEDHVRVAYRARHKDGGYRWLEANVRRWEDPETGEQNLRLAVSRDITAQKEAELQLQRTNTVLAAQQEAGIDGVLVVDEHQRVISFNRRFAELWEVPEALMAGRDDQAILAYVTSKLTHPEEFHAKVEHLYRHPDEASRDEIELTDGRVLDRYSAAAVSDDGHYFGRIWYFRDISDRKRLEATLKAQNQRLQDLNQTQTNFVYSVSHELRTPLTSIVGYAEFLEDGLDVPDETELLDYVHQIQLSTRRLQRLLDDLLDFALMEAGTFKLKLEPMDLSGKIQEMAESFRPQVAQGELRLEVALPDAPIELTVDPQRVGQVLANFIGNAVKMTPNGGLVRVSACREGDRWRIEVADTGPGIRPEDLPRLFNRFSQLENGTRRGGAGLGLSISKGLVEAHGGTVGVDSTPGKGSTFWFTLPA